VLTLLSVSLIHGQVQSSRSGTVVGVFLPVRVRTREMLSFVLLLISHGGEQRLQFEPTNPVITQPAEHCIATGHFWIQANVAE